MCGIVTCGLTAALNAVGVGLTYPTIYGFVKLAGNMTKSAYKAVKGRAHDIEVNHEALEILHGSDDSGGTKDSGSGSFGARHPGTMKTAAKGVVYFSALQKTLRTSDEAGKIDSVDDLKKQLAVAGDRLEDAKHDISLTIGGQIDKLKDDIAQIFAGTDVGRESVAALELAKQKLEAACGTLNAIDERIESYVGQF